MNPRIELVSYIPLASSVSGWSLSWKVASQRSAGLVSLSSIQPARGNNGPETERRHMDSLLTRTYIIENTGWRRADSNLSTETYR